MIADLFHRMKYMERRGSGLRKIVSETEKLPGYLEIYSTRSLGFLYNRKKQTRNLLKMTIPDKPNSRKQKYITVHSE